MAPSRIAMDVPSRGLPKTEAGPILSGDEPRLQGSRPMPRFAANLSMMFTEYDFLDRFAAAADAGFKAVEYLFPYEYPADELARRLERAGLEQALFNLPPGDWAKAERGLAALPGREADFELAVDRALAYAKPLRCPKLHAMAGILAPDADRALARRTYIANLRHGAPRRRGRDHAPDRTDQHQGHSRLLPQPAERGAPDHRGGGRAEPRAAVRRLSLPDHGRRPCDPDPHPCRHHRPYPDRRRAGTARAGRGRDQLSLPVRGDRPDRL